MPGSCAQITDGWLFSLTGRPFRTLTGVDEVAVLSGEGLLSLLLGAAGLGHDELDVVLSNLSSGLLLVRALELGSAAVSFPLRLPNSLLSTHQLLKGLGDTVLEATGGVGGLGSGSRSLELLLGGDLGSGGGVFDLGLAEDDVAVRSGGLVDLGLSNDEENVLGAAEGDALDSGDLLEAKTLKLLAGLALRARVDLDSGAGGGVVLKGKVLNRHGGLDDGFWWDGDDLVALLVGTASGPRATHDQVGV